MNENKNLTFAPEDRDRLFAAIGHIVVRFQQLELWISEALARLLNLKPLDDRLAVMSSMSFKQKVDLLYTLYSRKIEKPKSIDIDLARKAFNEAESYRNRIVHSVWATCSQKGTWIREKGDLRSKNGFSKKSLTVNIEELERSARSIGIITDWELISRETLHEAFTQISNCDKRHIIS